jgi:hypothetical protein
MKPKIQPSIRPLILPAKGGGSIHLFALHYGVEYGSSELLLSPQAFPSRSPMPYWAEAMLANARVPIARGMVLYGQFFSANRQRSQRRAGGRDPRLDRQGKVPVLGARTALEKPLGEP